MGGVYAFMERCAAASVLSVTMAAGVFAAGPPPEFTAAGVGSPGLPGILMPGAILSVYGKNLGPAGQCIAQPDPQKRETVNPRNPDSQFANLSVYPTELCDTYVLVGGKRAGLLYVSPKQINFKVPQDSAESGTVDLRVAYQGQLSAPVNLPAGFGRTTVSLAEPAYTGMPVWLKVDRRPGLGKVEYPGALGPADFGCSQVEVRRNGQLLPLRPGSNWMRYGGTFTGPPCGFLSAPGKRVSGRLPLHLLYRFDTPGTYEVRYTALSGLTRPGTTTRTQTDWTPIEILPATPNQRAEWLASVRQQAAADPAELISDVLPSVLGVPDDASFEIVVAHLWDADLAVRRYVLDGLSYWPEDSTSAKLLTLLHSRGPSAELVYYLLRQPAFRAAHQAEIAAACLPYLDSDSPVAIAGALRALTWPGKLDPQTFEAVLNAAGNIAAHGEPQQQIDAFQALAPSKDPRVHALLRKLTDQGNGAAAQFLIRFADPADLPSLGAVMAANPKADFLPYRPEELYQAFGAAAVPYLESALQTLAGRFGRTDVALTLMDAGDPAGFRFALQEVGRRGGLAMGMFSSLRSRFPQLKASSDGQIVAFLQARAGN